MLVDPYPLHWGNKRSLAGGGGRGRWAVAYEFPFHTLNSNGDPRTVLCGGNPHKSPPLIPLQAWSNLSPAMEEASAVVMPGSIWGPTTLYLGPIC